MGEDRRQDVTRCLRALSDGEDRAADRLLELVYGELHRMADGIMARERPGQTLQPTALVHEAWLRLVGDEPADWRGRAHFFGAAARAMRRVLVDAARSRGRLKRGAGLERAPLRDSAVVATPRPVDVLALDEALGGLERHDPRMFEVVMLRHFAGLTIEETARALEISVPTANRDWKFARAWLKVEMLSLIHI